MAIPESALKKFKHFGAEAVLASMVEESRGEVEEYQGEIDPIVCYLRALSALTAIQYIEKQCDNCRSTIDEMVKGIDIYLGVSEPGAKTASSQNSTFNGIQGERWMELLKSCLPWVLAAGHFGYVEKFVNEVSLDAFPSREEAVGESALCRALMAYIVLDRNECLMFLGRSGMGNGRIARLRKCLEKLCLGDQPSFEFEFTSYLDYFGRRLLDPNRIDGVYCNYATFLFYAASALEKWQFESSLDYVVEF